MIVTAAILDKGDVIKLLGSLYRIIDIKNGQVYFTHINKWGSICSKNGYNISQKSHEKIELIENPIFESEKKRYAKEKKEI